MVSTDNPILARRFRGGHVESIHRGAWVVANAAGEVLAGAGDAEQRIFARSASKSLQALPLAELIDAGRIEVPDAELAVTLASHNGEPQHIATVRSLLGRVGLDEDALQCGSTTGIWKSQSGPASRLRHDCSGKHAGFLVATNLLGGEPTDYLNADAPIQQAVRQAVLKSCRLDDSQIDVAIDGCSAPTYRLPLRGLATGIAAITSHAGASGGAARRLTDAAAAHPEMVAGDEPRRFDTDVMRASAGRLFSKVGAEGVLVIGVVGADLAFAGRIDDGDRRALWPLATDVLRQLGHVDQPLVDALESWVREELLNADGIVIGHQEIVAEL